MKSLLHIRYRWILILAAIGGVHHPVFDKLITTKWVRYVFKCYVYFITIMSLIYVILTIIHLLFMARTFRDCLLDIMVVSLAFPATGRLLWYIWKIQEFMKLYEFWDKYFVTEAASREREAIIDVQMSFVEKWMKSLTIIVFLTSVVWVIPQYFSETKIIQTPTPIPYRHQWPDYELLVTFYLIIATYQVFIGSAMQMFYMLPLIWEACELKHAKKSLQKLLKVTNNRDNLSPSVIEYLNTGLNSWIRQHHKLFSFHKNAWIINLSFSIEIFVTFMNCWMTAVTCVHDDMLMDEKVATFFYYLPCIIMFMLTCYYAEMVQEESVRLFEDAYSEDWMCLPKNLRRSLVLISERTRRPIVFKGFGLFVVGFETFSEILRFAYGVFNFLLNVPQ